MPPLPLINLAPLNTAAGCLQHLLLAECRGPAGGGYSFAELQPVARAMKSVVMNRMALGQDYRFCSVGAVTVMDFVCAPVTAAGCQQKQFAGFTSSPGQNTVVVAAAIMARIKQTVDIANNPSHPQQALYHQHVSFIVQLCATNGGADPYSAIPAIINGKAVLRGGYFWRTAGSGGPGGTTIEIPTPSTTQAPPGTLQGITFYTASVAAGFMEEDTEFI